MPADIFVVHNPAMGVAEGVAERVYSGMGSSITLLVSRWIYN